MKKNLISLAAVVVVLVLIGVAVVVSNDRKVKAGPVADPQVKSLQAQLIAAQAQLKQHDAVSATNTKNYGDQIANLNAQKTTLCAQIKAAKLPQPICQ